MSVGIGGIVGSAGEDFLDLLSEGLLASQVSVLSAVHVHVSGSEVLVEMGSSSVSVSVASGGKSMRM